MVKLFEFTADLENIISDKTRRVLKEFMELISQVEIKVTSINPDLVTCVLVIRRDKASILQHSPGQI